MILYTILFFYNSCNFPAILFLDCQIKSSKSIQMALKSVTRQSPWIETILLSLKLRFRPSKLKTSWL